MSNRTANYAAFYVAEPFSESIQEQMLHQTFSITINSEHGRERTVLSRLLMPMPKPIMFVMGASGKR